MSIPLLPFKVSDSLTTSSDSLPLKDLPRQLRWSRKFSLAAICIGLHVFLVVAHLALVFIHARGYEHGVVVSVGAASSRLALGASTITQIIGIAYTAGLVLITQQLSMRRDLHSVQKLSALHDKQAAWLGIGSSALTLWRQRKVKTSLWGVLTIALYLGGVFTIHVTTPAIFEVVSFNQTETIDLVAPMFTSSSNTTFSELTFGILPPSSNAGLTMPGLFYDIVYETINVPMMVDAVGEASVNASQYKVDCGLVQNITLDEAHFNATAGGWCPDPSEMLPFSGCISIANAAFSFPKSSPNVTYPTLFLVSYLPILDTNGKISGNISIDPQVEMTTGTGKTSDPSLNISSIQILGCNVGVYHGTMLVSTASGTTNKWPLELSPLDMTTGSWMNWTAPQQSSDPMLTPVAQLASSIPPWQSGVFPCVSAVFSQNASTSSTVCNNPSFLEAWMYTRLGLTFDSPQHTTLTDINAVLAEAMATLYWYNDQMFRVKTDSNATHIVYDTLLLRSRLNISDVPLYVGLSASCLLLAIAWLLTRHYCDEHQIHPALDTAGLLQLTWLLGHDPSITERIMQLDQPTTDELRRVGMFDVHVGEFVRVRSRKAASMTGSEADCLEGYE